jgi:hypothetical protein
MSSSAAAQSAPYAAPPTPLEGQVFADGDGGFWKVKRLTLAQNPVGFYLVHLCYGKTLDSLDDSLILGPREFAALIRDRDLQPRLKSL